MWHTGPARACLALFGEALLAGTVTAQAPVTFNGVLQSHTFRELNLGGVSHGGQVAATIDCLVSTQSCRKNGFLQYKDSAGQMLLSGPISDCKLRSFGMPFGGKSCASCRPFRLFSQSAACQAGPAGGARWAATMLGHGQGPKGRSGGGGGVMVGGRSHHRGGLCYIILGEGVASSQANTLADAGSHTHGHVLPASPGHTPSRLRHPLRSPGFEHIHPHSAHEHGDARHLGLRCERAQLRPGVL